MRVGAGDRVISILYMAFMSGAAWDPKTRGRIKAMILVNPAIPALVVSSWQVPPGKNGASRRCPTIAFTTLTAAVTLTLF